MRHHDNVKKLRRERGPRKAFMRSLARNLLVRGKMQTTLARAKAVRPMVEKLVTKGKNPTLQNRRALIAALGDTRSASRVISKAADYKSRAGGYLRIVKLGARKGDAAQMALIEFV
ncbi:MAG: 50S ribosomal protein L17 [Patescibacteria group bacterium]|nr:50S ribosomal protein L17 [Patescibacteria group bacterium]